MAISIHSVKAGHDLAKYFEEAFEQSREAGTFAPSEWYGNGAERAGLSGQIGEAEFEKALKGEIGGEHTHDGPGGKAHKPGTMLTFAPDKSVSIAALVGGDDRIKAAHTAAVKSTLDKLEQSGIEYRQGGEWKRSDNLTAALFHHSTSRNGDPQLHTHVVKMNATETDRGLRAINERSIYRLRPQLEGHYQSELAGNLRKLGYQTGFDKKTGAAQLSHVSQQARDLFSSRTADINKQLAAEGKNPERASQAERQYANYKTRNEKTITESPLDLGQQREKWQHQLREQGLERDAAAPQRTPVPPKPSAERVEAVMAEIVDRLEHNKAKLENIKPASVDYHTQHKVSAMSARETDLRQAMRREVPGITEQQFKAAVKSQLDEGRLHRDKQGGYSVATPEQTAAMKSKFANQARANHGPVAYVAADRAHVAALDNWREDRTNGKATQAAVATMAKWRDAQQHGRARLAQDQAKFRQANPRKAPTMAARLKRAHWQMRHPVQAVTQAATRALVKGAGTAIEATGRGVAQGAALSIKSLIAVAKTARNVVQAYKADTNHQRFAGVQVDRGAALKAAISEQFAKRTIDRAGLAKIDEARVGIRVRNGQMQVKRFTVKNLVLGAIARLEIRGVSDRAAANISYKRVGSVNSWRAERAMKQDVKLQASRSQRLQAKATTPNYAPRVEAYKQFQAQGDRQGLAARMKVDLQRDLSKLQAQFGKDAPPSRVKAITQALDTLGRSKANERDMSRAVETWSGLSRDKQQLATERAQPEARERSRQAQPESAQGKAQTAGNVERASPDKERSVDKPQAGEVDKAKVQDKQRENPEQVKGAEQDKAAAQGKAAAPSRAPAPRRQAIRAKLSQLRDRLKAKGSAAERTTAAKAKGLSQSQSQGRGLSY